MKNIARIALVSLLSTFVVTLMPNASAAISNNANTDLSIASASRTIFLGATDSTTTIGLTPLASTFADGVTFESITVTVSLSAPSGSALTASNVTLNQTAAQATASKFTLVSRYSNTYLLNSNDDLDGSDVTGIATLGIATPDVAGQYVITLTDGASNQVTRTLNVVDTNADLHTLAFSAGGTSSTATITAGESATVSFTSSFISSAATDSITVKANLVDAPDGGLGTAVYLDISDSATSSGSMTFSSIDRVTGSSGLTAQAGAVASTNKVVVNAILYAPLKAGTYTMRIVDLENTNSGATAWNPAITPLTFTVTVTGAVTTAGANSYSVLRTGTAAASSGTAKTDSTVVASKSAATTVTSPQATIYVTEDNATGTASESFTVSVSGPATVGTSSSSRPSASAATFAYTQAAEPVYVWANGTAGTATITVKTLGGITVGTHTVYFAGDRTAIANAADPVPLTNLRAGGKTLDAWYVSLKDAAGMPVIGANSSLSCVIADTLVVASCSFADQLDGTYLLTLTSASGSTSGKSTTVTVRTTDPAVTTSTAYISAAAVTVTLASTANKYTITTDKSSYTPGEQMIVTVSAVDASGNPVHDGASVPTVLSNKSVTGLSSIGSTFAAGKADSISRDSDGTVLQQYRVFAPASSGSFDLYFDYSDAALAAQRATVTATVADAGMDAATDAANEATDAANAATDAALAAADAADAATAAAQDASDAVAALSASVSKMISSLRAKITSLTNLVIKIQKKVRA